MQLYSTNNPALRVGLREALFQGLPADNGLFMPVDVPRLPEDFMANLANYSFTEIGFHICRALFDGAIPEDDLRRIVEQAIDFPAPVVPLTDRIFVLELFHGPSLAFKDFGARFMARLMSYFNKEEEQDLTILVATSGDTGGAVAAGFYQTPGIQVVILYPSGKVSHLQEKQLTTLGHNIKALEIDGAFDDCQALVKQAFLDQELRTHLRLSSANSINIARLIPQSFYYFEAYKQLPPNGDPIVFSVPSGNFGNLTAGLLAWKMGLPVHHFIAATNINDVVPEYLHTSHYQPRASRRTLSNAMDVGAPSNFARMLDLFGQQADERWNRMRRHISGYAADDEATARAVREIYTGYDYLMDPHGAVGYLALQEYQRLHPHTRGIILETAHPAKFKPDMDQILGIDTPVPERLAALADQPKAAVKMGTDYEILREWLLADH